MDMNPSITRREFLRGCAGLGMTLLLPELVTGCATAPATRAATAQAIPTPFDINTRPAYPPTPGSGELAPSALLTAYNRWLNPEGQKTVRTLINVTSDPLINTRLAEVYFENSIAARPGGPIEVFNTLKREGKAIGGSLCGDSRPMCDLFHYGTDDGTAKKIPEFAVIEERTLGAAPRVFQEGVNVSFIATHSTSAMDITGCGALQAMAKLKEPGGADFLVHHGIDPGTIARIQATLQSTNADEQAIIAAKLQAMMNSYEHGGARHITVAMRIGHADGSFTLIDAFDNTGARVPVPDFMKAYIEANRAPMSQLDQFLAKGQAPFEAVINSSSFNIQQLMGYRAQTPGFTFKITARPQSGNLVRAINLSEVDAAIDGINYPLAHTSWNRLQWLIANSPEELAMLRLRLLQSPKAWEFLGRGGVIAEAVANEQGLMTGSFRITQLADIPEIAKAAMTARRIGTVTTEIALSQKTFYEARRMINAAKLEGVVEVSKWEEALSNVVKIGKVGLKILNILQPVFIAQMIIEGTESVKKKLGMDIIYDSHGVRWSTVKQMDAIQYQALQRANPKVEPFLSVPQMYETTPNPYTKKELAGSFWDLLNDWKLDVDSQDLWDKGPKNPQSKYYGMGFTDLAKVLAFDYKDIHDGQKHKILVKNGAPLVFSPLPMKGPFGEERRFFTSADELEKYQFMILNTETGEFLVSGMDGEMVVPVVATQPSNGMGNTVYFMHLHMGNDGNLIVKNVGFDDSGKSRSMLDTQSQASRELDHISDGAALGYLTGAGVRAGEVAFNSNRVPAQAIIFQN